MRTTPLPQPPTIPEGQTGAIGQASASPAAYHLGPGPGSQLLQALASNWGTQITREPADPPNDLLLPTWWMVLLHGDGLDPQSGWTPHWHTPTPAGPWAPNALTLMTHSRGTTVAVDLDPDEQGQRACWGHCRGCLHRVALDLPDLAELLNQGPQAWADMGMEKLDDPIHGASPPTPRTVASEDLPFDPISRQWQSRWTETPMQVMALDQAGMGLTLTPGWLRHPTQPLIALALNPES